MKKMSRKAVSMLMVFLLLTVFTMGEMPVTVRANTSVKVTVTHPQMNMIKLSWDKVSGAAGYNIYYSASQNGTYKLVTSSKDTSVIFNDLQTDTYYYFKVVAYTMTNNVRVEGASSGVLKVRSNRIGIDVSFWQGKNIDWNKVKADGIEFAFARIAYGTTADTCYETNLKGAAAAGIPIGVYVYSKGMTTAEVTKEANNVVELLKGYKLSYPVVFDIESDSYHKDLSAATNTSLVKTFMGILQKAGYEVVLYTGCSFSQSSLNMSQLTMYDWWIPHYWSSESYYPYSGNFHFRASTDSKACYYAKNKVNTRFWQYTECGKVNGISGNVDMNYELDLKEPVNGSIYVNLKTGAETYVAEANETIKSIAEKLGIDSSVLLKNNTAYQLTSTVAAGKSIIIDSTVRTIGAPNVKVALESKSSIKVSYDKVAGAAGYEIYWSTSKNGTYTKVATTTDASYIHKGLTSGTTYYYKVVSYATIDGNNVTATSAIASVKLGIDKTAKITAESTGYNSNKITWDKVSGAAGYKLYSSTSKNGTYQLIKTTTSNSYTHSNLKNNTTVYYKVKAYMKAGKDELESGYSSVASAKPVQAKVTDLKATSTTESSVTLSFSKSANATYYKVFRATSKNGTYTSLGKTTTNSFTSKNLSKNTTYYYKVRAYRTVGSTTYNSEYSSVFSVKTASGAPKITKITGAKKAVSVEWSKVSGATGYELYRATSKNGTYKLVTSKTSRTVNNTGLAKNTTYYYKVRSYSVVNKKKVYSSYSEIKSVKTLK